MPQEGEDETTKGQELEEESQEQAVHDEGRRRTAMMIRNGHTSCGKGPRLQFIGVVLGSFSLGDHFGFS